MDLKDYIGIIKRRKWMLALIWVVLVALLVFFNLVLDQPFYSAQSTMNIGPLQLSQDPRRAYLQQALKFEDELQKLNKPAVEKYRRLYHPVVFALKVLHDVLEHPGREGTAAEQLNTDQALATLNETLATFEPQRERSGGRAVSPDSVEALHYPLVYPKARAQRATYVGDYPDRGRFPGIKEALILLRDEEVDLTDRHDFAQALAVRWDALTQGAVRYLFLGGKPLAPPSSVLIAPIEKTRFYTVSVTHADEQGAWLYAAAQVFAAVYYDDEKAKQVQQVVRANVDSQITRTTELIRDLSDRLAALEEQYPFHLTAVAQEVSYGEETRREQRLKDEVERRLKALREEYDELDAYRRLAVASPGEEIANPTAQALFFKQPRILSLREDLERLRAEQVEMSTRYNYPHPRMQENARRTAAKTDALWREKLLVLEERMEFLELELRNQTRTLEHHTSYLARLTSLAEENRRQRAAFAEQRGQYDQMTAERDSFKAGLESLSNRKSELEAQQASVHGNFYYDHESGYGFRAVPEAKRSSNIMVLGIVLAFLVALAVVALVEYLNTEVKTEYDIRRYLNLPVLGIVPHVKGDILLTDAPLKSRISELFNTTATLIRSHAKELSLRSFVVSSANPKEGKTTISVNLGVAMARKGMKVILIDSDLRRPQIHHIFGLDNVQGVSTVLEYKLPGASPDQPLAATGFQQVVHTETDIANLHILTSGPTPPDPVGLLESDIMKQLVQELMDEYDVVIFDTPPIGSVGDTLILSQYTDANIFIVGAGQVEYSEVTQAKRLLQNVHTNILGVFLNKSTEDKSKEYYYYYSDDTRRVGRIR